MAEFIREIIYGLPVLCNNAYDYLMGEVAKRYYFNGDIEI
jgi:hypothetical protein